MEKVKEQRQLACKIVHLIHNGFEKYTVIVKNDDDYYDDYLCAGGSVFYGISNYKGKNVIITTEFKKNKIYIVDVKENNNV